jgi:hypothetical protein
VAGLLTERRAIRNVVAGLPTEPPARPQVSTLHSEAFAWRRLLSRFSSRSSAMSKCHRRVSAGLISRPSWNDPQSELGWRGTVAPGGPAGARPGDPTSAPRRHPWILWILIAEARSCTLKIAHIIPLPPGEGGRRPGEGLSPSLSLHAPSIRIVKERPNRCARSPCRDTRLTAGLRASSGGVPVSAHAAALWPLSRQANDPTDEDRVTL